ncbi:MAG TPA: tripartite tricarboxylate transporter substrate binding protein [Burkholderiales bacterium]|nr:tripartite tricarboxylate transporter substrate binding protein [Burkholderiales bacterium]
MSKQILAALGLAVAGAGAVAQPYPSKPIRFVVATAAGGASDIVARTLAERMQEGLGQPIVVEAKPGANGNLAAEYVAKSAPDGYTMMMGTIGVMAINPSMYRKVAFDPLTDFVPVAPLVSFANILVVRPDLPVKNVEELIEYARANPGRLRYGSPGSGGSPHMAMVVFGQMNNLDIVHVPYKGAAAALNDLLGGHIDMAFSDPLVTTPQVNAGRVRALAVSGPQRLESAPDIPTVAEAGVPGYAVVGWLGIVVPAGTPPDRIARLNAEANKALANPGVRKRLIDNGALITPGTPEDFDKLVRSEYQRWKKVVSDSKLVAE